MNAGTLSMRPLAKRAKVAASTPYNLFGSKQSIVSAVLAADLEQFIAMLELMEPCNSIENIFNAIELSARRYEDEPRFYRTLLSSAYFGSDSGTTEQFEAPRLASWEDILANAISEGLLNDNASPAVLGKTIIHILLGAALDWVRGKIGISRMRAEIGWGIALLLRSIATDKSAAFIQERLDHYNRALQPEQKAPISVVRKRSGARAPKALSA
jgi:AcrR family transcriptional regulator